MHFQETLSTVQLASRVHRLRRRRMKPHVGGSGSGGSSEESRSGKSSRGTITDTGSSSVDPSSSEQSCDTVIYIGPGNDDATDGEHPPVYLPSINSGDNRCMMKKALRGSTVDTTTKDTIKTPKKPTKSISKSPKHCASPKGSSPQRTTNDYGAKTNEVLNSSEEKCTTNGTVKTPAKYLPPSVSKLSSTDAIPKSPRTLHISRHKNSATSGVLEVSDEQWIDGPKVSKVKKFEGYKVKGCDLETWIDGPEATYGYMDDHKKTMIQKWVETQNGSNATKNGMSPKNMTKQTHYKELTQFKTVEEEDSSPKHKKREKRRSIETKKDIRVHIKEKDSPHRRKSYSDKPNSLQVLEGGSTRPKSQVNSANSTPSKFYSKDNAIVGSDPANATSSVELNNLQRTNPQKGNVTKQTAPDIISKLVDEMQTNNDSLLNGVCKQSNDKHLIGDGPKPYVDVSNDEATTKEDENEEVLQIIQIETEGGKVDTKIHQALSQASDLERQEDSKSDDGNAFVGADEVSSQCSDDSQQKLILEDQLLKVATKRFQLPNNSINFDGLDEEAEDQLNLSLDRWLADEEREFIEVTEPEEPVEMVDSWVQVTEEDLERTMAEAGIAFVPFLPHRHLLPTLEEEPAEIPNEEITVIPQLIPVSAKSYFENTLPEDLLNNKRILDPVDYRSSSRYEQMISDPNFTAKTNYFAKRLEELRQLHETYRNLAKQAPRGRNSIHSQLDLLPQLSEDDNLLMESSSVSEKVEESRHQAYDSNSFLDRNSALSSLRQNGNFDFDWKSLLPEELDLHSDYGDLKNDGDDSVSEMSKEYNDPLYDIQSDIMPYLPSNYINLTNLSSAKPAAVSETETAIQRDPHVLLENFDNKEETHPNGNIIVSNKDKTISERTMNRASLSDDENNVKQVKVKKEKRKKKLGLLSKSPKTTKKDGNDNDQTSHSSKLSWSRFFGSPKSKQPSKSPKKSKSNSSKNSGKSAISGKIADKKKSKESKTSNFKDEKFKDNKIILETDKSSDKKYVQRMDSDRHSSSPKNTKSPSRRSSDSRSGSSSRSQRCRNDSSIKNQTPFHSDISTKSSSRYHGTLQWDTFQPVNTPSSSGHGYDSGTDSGVGLKVISRGKRTRVESRQGESSGYESVIRDSECSSFGSSQDSGLDDDGLKAIGLGKGKAACKQIIKEESHNDIEDGSQIETEVEKFDEEDVARYENHTTEEDILKCRRTQEKIRALREKQDELKKELEAAKGRLSIDKSSAR